MLGWPVPWMFQKSKDLSDPHSKGVSTIGEENIFLDIFRVPDLGVKIKVTKTG